MIENSVASARTGMVASQEQWPWRSYAALLGNQPLPWLDVIDCPGNSMPFPQPHSKIFSRFDLTFAPRSG